MERTAIDYHHGLAGIYFRRIQSAIIELGNLGRPGARVLDFGCGSGELKKRLPGAVVGFDIVPERSDVSDWRSVEFDTVVVNEVFYVFEPDQMRSFLSELRGVNKAVTVIVGVSKQGFLNRIAAFLSGRSDAHDETKIGPEQEVAILGEQMSIMKKKGVFFMCDVFLLRFKPSRDGEGTLAADICKPDKAVISITA